MYLFIDHAAKFGHLVTNRQPKQKLFECDRGFRWHHHIVFTIHTITHDKIGIHLLIFDAHF